MTSRTICAGSLFLALALALAVPSGCMQQKAAGKDKKGSAQKSKGDPALTAKEQKAAGKTIKAALQKSAKPEKPAAAAADSRTASKQDSKNAAKADSRGDARADSRTPADAPRMPDLSYADMDTAKLAAVMDDILLTPEPYYYASVGRRDVFEPLVVAGGGGEGDEIDSDRDFRVVGILWAEHDRFALVEASSGRCRILREGDSLGDGIVSRVYPDKIIVHISQYGTSRNITMPLVQGGGFDESPRSRGR